MRLTAFSRLSTLLPPSDAESDPAFRALVDRQTQLGMRLAAWLGIVGVALFVGLQTLAGQRMALTYGENPSAVVVITDDLLVATLCCLLLALSRRPVWVRRSGRLLLGSVLVVSGAAIAVDDAARGDYSFTAAWLGLVLLVGVGAVPFRPRSALGMWAILACFAGTLALLWPGYPGSEGIARPVAYFLLMAPILTSLSALLYTSRYRQHHALREAERLREQLTEQERRRIADDLHDDLGSKISAFALRLEVAASRAPDDATRNDLDSLAHQTRRLVSELRDTIWLVDAQHDTADALIERVRDAAAGLLAGRSFTVEATTALPPGALPAPVRRAVFLATREALHNAARHADPRHVHVRFAHDAGRLHVSVHDDGGGFDPGGVRAGRGLASLRHRASQAGGTAEVTSRPGSGTSVTLDVPLTAPDPTEPQA